MEPLSARQAAALADEVEARAFADLFDAAPPGVKSALRPRVERVADATLLVTPGIPSAMFNRAIGLGMRQPAGPREVQAIADVYRAAGVSTWWLHCNPHAVPADLAVTLAAMGYTPAARRTWAKMLRGPDAPPVVATGLVVAPVRDAQADAAARAIVQAFEMPDYMVGWFASLHGRPGWQMYAACDGDAVVGGGCLYVAGGSAWLGVAGMLPSHRRRGGQGALLARRIADAAAAGVRRIVTETGEPVADEPNPSLANIRRVGFATVASRLNLVGPPA